MRSPLRQASANGHTKAIQLLLSADGINIDNLEEIGGTPLHIAAENGHTEVVQLLLDAGADVNYTAANNYSPLHAALENENPRIEIIKLLIGYGANIYEELLVIKPGCDDEECTPLKIAQRKGFTEIEKLLLESHKINLENHIVDSFLNF